MVHERDLFRVQTFPLVFNMFKFLCLLCLKKGDKNVNSYGSYWILNMFQFVLLFLYCWKFKLVTGLVINAL